MDYLADSYNNVKIKPVTCGTKILELVVQNTKFIDSLKHLPGSLAALAKSFGLSTQKGVFPHLFNSTENYEYEGPIPGIEYYELPFTMKTQDDIDDFKRWHALQTEQAVVWNFKAELIKYCIDDVRILAELMLKHHDINYEMFNVSPWFSTTSPGYGLKVQLGELSTPEYLGLPDDEGDAISRDRRLERINKLAWDDHWGVLEPVEYWGARGALRGGRTDVKKIYHKLSPAEIARGCKISYVDVVSMYPGVQLEEKYPVGLPTIYIYDPEYYPCLRHSTPQEGNFSTLKCSCLYKNLKKQGLNSLKVRDLTKSPKLTKEEILADDSFFGWALVTLYCPLDMYHPVLPVYDGKCVFPVGLLPPSRWPCVEIKYALQCGYELIEIHRYDKYNSAPGLWNNIIKKLYIEKMANSEPAPSPENQQRLIDAYEKKFQMGDMVAQSFSRWNFNPPKRQAYKIALNSGWGKHCQRPNLGGFQIVGDAQIEDHTAIFRNVENNNLQLSGFHSFGNSTGYKLKNRRVQYNFHKGYLPAGMHVPAYGRMKLHRELAKLGKRVLYYDTDSIIYIYDPEECYNVPSSDILGEWDEEKISKEGIAEFIGLGPKSYGLRTFSGKDVVKVKGLSLKQAHHPIFNFDILKSLIQSHINEKKYPQILVPQQTFSYHLGRGIRVEHLVKKFSFQPEILKGNLKDDLFIYPPISQ